MRSFLSFCLLVFIVWYKINMRKAKVSAYSTVLKVFVCSSFTIDYFGISHQLQTEIILFFLFRP